MLAGAFYEFSAVRCLSVCLIVFTVPFLELDHGTFPNSPHVKACPQLRTIKDYENPLVTLSGGFGELGTCPPSKGLQGVGLTFFLFLTSHEEISFLKHVLPLMWAASPSP